VACAAEDAGENVTELISVPAEPIVVDAVSGAVSVDVTTLY
jgi:hypothetical protein